MSTAVMQWIDSNNDNLQQLVPGGIEPFRVKSSALALLQADQRNDGKISKCTPASVVACVARIVSLGLDAMSGDAYFVPYGRELEMSLSPQGCMKVITRAANVAHVEVDIVRANDRFEVGKNSDGVTFEHEPEPFGSSEIVGAYVAVYYTNGHTFVEMMNREDIERAKSKSKNTSKKGPWGEWFGEMAKKTVLHRAMKRIASVSDHDRAIMKTLTDIENPEPKPMQLGGNVSGSTKLFPTEFDEPAPWEGAEGAEVVEAEVPQ